MFGRARFDVNGELEDQASALLGGDESDSETGGVTGVAAHLPAILPPKGEIDNPVRAVQWPGYCCRCELKKKITV